MNKVSIEAIIASFLAVGMAIVYAGNDAPRIAKNLSKKYTFRKLSINTVAMFIALLMYLPPLGLFFLPSLVFGQDSATLLCCGVTLAALWLFMGYLLTGA